MKRVLIISYYWPPCGGVGVLRCLKIAKYLRHYGWEPIVYTAQNAHYPSYDPTNLKDIPTGLTVLKQPIFEPYAFYKVFTGKPKNANVNNDLVAAENRHNWKYKLSVFIRSNFFIPDARAFWVKPSVKYLAQWLKQNPVDAIFSDGPPHSNTLIACRLKQATGIPWLADFQDPWTQVDYYQRLMLAPWADAKHRRLEQEAFRHADRITIASDTWKRDLESIGAKNVSVLHYGYDHQDFEALNAAPDWKLTLTHTGLIGDDRNPAQLLAAMAQLAQELPDFNQLFRLRLIGQVDAQVKQSIAAHGVGHLVELVDNLPRREALQQMVNAQVLLLILNQADNANGRIPGKLFEYMAARRPVLCLGPPQSDVAQLLHYTQAGEVAAHHDTARIKALLLQHYHSYKAQGNIASTTNPHIAEFTNQRLTGKVAHLLNQIAKPKAKF